MGIELSNPVRFLTSSSLFLALNGSMVVAFGFFLYGHEIAPEIVLAAFLVTFSVYGLNKATDKVEDSVNKRDTVSRPARYYVVSSLAAMVACLTIGFLDGITVFFVLLTPLLIGLIYSIKFVKTLPRLKEIVGVKSLAVATSWAATGALLPSAFQQAPMEKVFLVFSYIFIQLLINTIIFDTMDMKGDKISGVLTIPMVLGKSKTKTFLTGLNTSLGFWLGYCVLKGLFTQFMPALFFGFFYGYLVIWLFTCKNGRRQRAELIIDGEWIPIIALIKAILR